VKNEISRRGLLVGGASAAGGVAGWTGVALGGSGSGRARSEQAASGDRQPRLAQSSFVFGLNTSTIRGQKLSIVDEITLASRAGYGALEPWIDELEKYAASGGSLDDLGKRLRDSGISVPSAIGFFEWIVDDPDRRRKGLEATRRGMELVRRIGGERLAAPPVGAIDAPICDLVKIAGRYRALLELGDQMGVVPQVEIWGFSRTLSRLGEAACVAIEAHHPKACILPDVYHLYRGGSDFKSLRLLGPSSVHVLHLNDFPADPPREKLNDADRVYPGDGVAPLRELLFDLAQAGMRVTLSLELFNRKYWTQDPQVVASTGLEKMKGLFRGGVSAPP
jgi:sugar phosphate isomerase/epimerase